MATNGKKFSVDFEQATKVNGNTQILVQSECQPVEKASVEQLGVALMEEDIIPNPDGNYPQMSVGFAEHLVGDGTATEEEFSFHPTAGVNRNVETTTYDYDMRSNFGARIESVKGNSVVWNQQINNEVGTTASGQWRVRTGIENASAENGIITWTIIDSTINMLVQYLSSIKNGDYIFCSFGYNSPAADEYGRPLFITFGAGLSQRNVFPEAILRTNALSGFTQGVFQLKTTRTDIDTVLIKAGSVAGSIGQSIIIDNFKFINLTQMFGAGNEPTTVDEFYSLLPTNIDLNAYNVGEIVDANYGAIKTTGFNQYNGIYAKVLGGVKYYLGGTYTSIGYTTEEGGTTEAITIPSDKYYTPSQNGYIYAQGTDICINIAWDEYSSLNGTYAPYKPFERDLSWIAESFPEGMRRAGSVSDEIRFNSTTQKWEAMQRVGVRAYTSGDESDTTLTTDGTNTNYPLATPIFAEIEEIPSLDYDVADYGTEELIAPEGVKSAPFLGNIIYTPNALKTLEQVPDILKRLTALEAAVASATSTTTTE